jgi:hypothetical protein
VLCHLSAKIFLIKRKFHIFVTSDQREGGWHYFSEGYFCHFHLIKNLKKSSFYQNKSKNVREQNILYKFQFKNNKNAIAILVNIAPQSRKYLPSPSPKYGKFTPQKIVPDVIPRRGCAALLAAVYLCWLE